MKDIKSIIDEYRLTYKHGKDKINEKYWYIYVVVIINHIFYSFKIINLIIFTWYI